jgi:hypothetical protein
MEKETLEEAAKRIYPINIVVDYDTNEDIRNIWIEGAKWQAERSFNNEEVIKIIQECKSYLSFGDEFDEINWFEQFKKK